MNNYAEKQVKLSFILLYTSTDSIGGSESYIYQCGIYLEMYKFCCVTAFFIINAT